MNISLQITMITLSVFFFTFITYFVKRKRLQIKQALIWYLTCILFIVLSIIPEILNQCSALLNIIDPTNTLFLIMIAFLMIIVFLNAITISKNCETITLLTQELSILKARYEGKAGTNTKAAPSRDAHTTKML